MFPRFFFFVESFFKLELKREKVGRLNRLAKNTLGSSHGSINHLRWQLIADHNEWPNSNSSLSDLNSIGTTSLDRNYWEAINCFGFYLNTLKTEEMLQFWGKKFSTCVARRSSVGNWLRTITSDRTVHDNSSLSFSSQLVGVSLVRND